MEAVELKQCGPMDIPQIMQVSMQSYREHYLYLWTEERYAAWYMNRSFGAQSLAAQMQDNNSVFYLVQLNHTAVGYVKLNRNKALPGDAANKSLELERIYLLKEAAGKGVGKAAVQQVETLAGEWGYNIIWLKSMDSSPAVYFYEKVGFEKVATERLPFEGFVDAYRNLVTMRKELL